LIIKIDISNASNTSCRALTLDVLSGYVSRDYAYGLKQKEVIESTCATLSNMFGYLLAMHTCHDKLRYFDGTGSPREGQRGGHQGDPLEMLIFNLTTLHLWGRTLAKYPHERALVC
jgi:hypothetical protein